MGFENPKVSPAFDPFMSQTAPDQRRDAIVIYRAMPGADAASPANLREHDQRLAFVKSRAQNQFAAVQAQLSEGYQRSSNKFLPQREKNHKLHFASIGSNTLPVAVVQVTPRTLNDLASQENVVAVLPNQKIRLIQPRQVSYEELGTEEVKNKLTWGIQHMELPKIWKKSRGKGVKVAVLDTGVHGVHPSLVGRVKKFVVIDPLGRRLELLDDKTFDSAQHGTHVCGTIAGGKTPDGIQIGVAPEADLLAAGVLVGNATLRTLIEGISWAIEQGADIINMSLGFSYYEPLFDRIFQMLLNDYGVLPVVAIGNENYGNSSSPGNAANAFSVGAMENNPHTGMSVAPFSSGASLVFPGELSNPPLETTVVTKPDVVAPGVQVLSCIPPEERSDGTHLYTWMDGTSMATPHVSGVAALLMSANPNAPVTAIAQALKKTAKQPTTGLRPDNRWGYGMVQPVRAFEELTGPAIIVPPPNRRRPRKKKTAKPSKR